MASLENEITIRVKVEEGDHDPAIIGIFSYYGDDYSRYPDRIRVSFIDGHTEIYDIHRDQPHTIIERNCEIIRKWKQGYNNQPTRRRRRRR